VVKRSHPGVSNGSAFRIECERIHEARERRFPVAIEPAARRGPSLLSVFLFLTAGGLATLIFVVVPVLGHIVPFPVRLEFYVSVIFLIIGTAIVFFVGNRRPPGTPLTWGEAIIASTFIFGLMLLAYGIVPNEWLKWADNQLLWRPDKLLLAISSKGIKFGQTSTAIGGRGRITVTYQALRDIIAATIYILMLGLHVGLWVAFQKRGRRPAAAEGAVERRSRFGRPVVSRA
jgi:hypothetical protein